MYTAFRSITYLKAKINIGSRTGQGTISKKFFLLCNFCKLLEAQLKKSQKNSRISRASNTLTKLILDYDDQKNPLHLHMYYLSAVLSNAWEYILIKFDSQYN
jgi:hypothetical protein